MRAVKRLRRVQVRSTARPVPPRDAHIGDEKEALARRSVMARLADGFSRPPPTAGANLVAQSSGVRNRTRCGTVDQRRVAVIAEVSRPPGARRLEQQTGAWLFGSMIRGRYCCRYAVSTGTPTSGRRGSGAAAGAARRRAGVAAVRQIIKENRSRSPPLRPS
jgi:hypothetical protein